MQTGYLDFWMVGFLEVTRAESFEPTSRKSWHLKRLIAT